MNLVFRPELADIIFGVRNDLKWKLIKKTIAEIQLVELLK